MPPLNLIYWVLIIVWAIFGPGYGFVATTPNPRVVSGGNILLLVLFIILGIVAFGK